MLFLGFFISHSPPARPPAFGFPSVPTHCSPTSQQGDCLGVGWGGRGGFADRWMEIRKAIRPLTPTRWDSFLQGRSLQSPGSGPLSLLPSGWCLGCSQTGEKSAWRRREVLSPLTVPGAPRTAPRAQQHSGGGKDSPWSSPHFFRGRGPGGGAREGGRRLSRKLAL